MKYRIESKSLSQEDWYGCGVFDNETDAANRLNEIKRNKSIPQAGQECSADNYLYRIVNFEPVSDFDHQKFIATTRLQQTDPPDSN